MDLSAISYRKFVDFALEELKHRGALASLPSHVLDFAVFPETAFDIPIFCANFFTTSSVSVIVLDLNPLYDVTVRKDYKEKYYRKLLPLAQKYMESQCSFCHGEARLQVNL